MAKADGSVIIDSRLNTAGFGKGVAGLKSQFAGLGSSVRKLGGVIATAFSIKAIVSFSKEAIQLASDLQEVQNVVDVTFTTMNEQINEFAKNAAKTAGLSETMAKRYAGTFGAMAKSFRFTEAKSYAMATALTQLTGDVASFYNLTQDEAYTKLKSVFTGETESLKDLGVVMTQTALDDFALRKGLKKTTSQMTEQEKVALRYQFVLEQLSGASGDFVRTSDSWANQTRVLKLQFDQLKATLGQAFINVLTPALKLLNQLIERFQVLANSFLEFTNAVFGNAEGASAGLEATAESAGLLSDNLESTEQAAKKADKALAGFDEITKISTKESSGGSQSVEIGIEYDQSEVKKANKDFSKISTVFDELKEILEPLNDIDFSNLVGALKNLWNSLKPFGKKALSGLQWLLEEILIPLAEWVVEDALPVFLDTISAALDALNAILIAIQPTLTWLWEDIIKPMAAFAGQLFIDFLNFLTDAFTRLSDWALENKETVNTIFQIFLGFLAGVWVYNTTKKIISFLGSLGTAFTNLGNLLGGAGLKFAFVAAAIGILAAGIIELSKNWDKMTPADKAVAILTALAAAATAAAIAIGVFHTAWSVGVAAAAIAGGLALLGLSFAFTSTGDTGDAAMASAESFYNSYDWNKSFSLPMLAEGAVIPPNAPFAAILGDQRHGTNIEAPLSTIQEAVALVMEDYAAANIAGHEATVAVLRDILEAVLGIHVGDDVIGQAVARYNARMAIIKGGNA